MKRFASLLLTVVMLAAMLSVFAVPASADVTPANVVGYGQLKTDGNNMQMIPIIAAKGVDFGSVKSEKGTARHLLCGYFD